MKALCCPCSKRFPLIGSMQTCPCWPRKPVAASVYLLSLQNPTSFSSSTGSRYCLTSGIVAAPGWGVPLGGPTGHATVDGATPQETVVRPAHCSSWWHCQLGRAGENGSLGPYKWLTQAPPSKDLCQKIQDTSLSCLGTTGPLCVGVNHGS